MDKLKQCKKILILLVDIGLVNFSYILAFYFTITNDGIGHLIQKFFGSIIAITIIYIIVLYAFNLYKSLWEYASTDEFLLAIGGCVSGGILSVVYGIVTAQRLPFRASILAGIFSIILIVGFRLFYRIYRRIAISRKRIHKSEYQRVLVIGAGYAGNMIIREMRAHPEMKFKPVVIIDDDVAKIGKNLLGLQIYGNRNKLFNAIDLFKVDVIVIAIPSLDRRGKDEIIELCKSTKCKIKIVPTVYDLLDRRSPLRKMRDVEVEDLLGRELINLDMDGISNYISQRVVLITGGGGTIGSEIARQVAAFKPKQLLVLDIYENNVYDLQMEMKHKFPRLDVKILIASVGDSSIINYIFSEYKPEIVFHAAAHKHVPLMEENPVEAIKNNVFGTLHLAECASKYKVKEFVLISTDKAVNPTSIMGVTKRISEMIVQGLDKISDTKFAAVRFGNVLGSNGSVIPLFKKQIAQGGPITVTHKNITRYFMAIQEAAQLVLQAGAFAKGGEIFVLDMGSPVKIYDLAYELIRLSGLEINVDVEIKFTGLRPGEKLYEEVLMDEEGLDNTPHKKIFVGTPFKIEYNSLRKDLLDLQKLLDKSKRSELIDKLQKLVPTYTVQLDTQDIDEIAVISEI